MAEIDKKLLAKVVGFDEDAENLKKEVAIIKDKKQFSIRIPTKFAELCDLDVKKDVFVFTLEPLETGGFTIQADLKRNK